LITGTDSFWFFLNRKPLQVCPCMDLTWACCQRPFASFHAI